MAMDEYLKTLGEHRNALDQLSINCQLHDYLHRAFGTEGPADASDTGPSPFALDADLKHFKELFSKLKFSYLEQETKEKYLHAILDDPPLVVEARHNIEIEQANLVHKQRLKERKRELEAIQNQLIAACERACDDRNSLTADMSEAEELLRDLTAMEEELAQISNEEDITEQNLPLPDSMAILESREKDNEDLMLLVTQLNEAKVMGSAQYEAAVEELAKLQKIVETQEARAESALLSKVEESCNKEGVGKWYRAVIEIQSELGAAS